MSVINEKISQEKFLEFLGTAPFFKIAVDLEREKISAGCELHSDCAEELIADGSQYKNVWGANIYRDRSLDFISLINIRPPRNRSMNIGDENIVVAMKKIAEKYFGNG